MSTFMVLVRLRVRVRTKRRKKGSRGDEGVGGGMDQSARGRGETWEGKTKTLAREEYHLLTPSPRYTSTDMGSINICVLPGGIKRGWVTLIQTARQGQDQKEAKEGFIADEEEKENMR